MYLSFLFLSFDMYVFMYCFPLSIEFKKIFSLDHWPSYFLLHAVLSFLHFSAGLSQIQPHFFFYSVLRSASSIFSLIVTLVDVIIFFHSPLIVHYILTLSSPNCHSPFFLLFIYSHIFLFFFFFNMEWSNFLQNISNNHILQVQLTNHNYPIHDHLKCHCH